MIATTASDPSATPGGAPGVARAEIVARLLLTIGALLPYWPLLSFSVIHVTDDGFTSDIWNGELPSRVWAAARLRDLGAVPAWTRSLCSGAPVVGLDEPLSRLLFLTLPPAAALDALLVIWLLVAAHGTYALARRVGADRGGAALGGMAFAASGYLVCQLKHLGIVGTVVWLPVGLALLDRALARHGAAAARPGSPAAAGESANHVTTPDGAPGPDARPAPDAMRAVSLVLFGFVFAEQVLAGFPQSTYICALTYGAYALHRVLANPQAPSQRWFSRLAPLPGTAVVLGLGAAVGAVLLLPLAELGGLSDRGGGGTYEWAARWRYWPGNALTFLLPYVNGDASDGTYRKPSVFWEDYGYVGAAPFLLAIYAAVRDWRRGRTRMFIAMTLVAYLIVLGPATPVHRAIFELVPGMRLFRLPTRFLVVVDLGLCVLAALGLSRLARDLRARLRPAVASRAAQGVVLAVGVLTALDLLMHQFRQNPMVPAGTWLAPPRTAGLLLAEPGPVRVYTPFHAQYHFAANRAARGWSDLRPYFMLRDLIEPNTNLYWDLATADCYAGIAPSWHVDVWGDHNRAGGIVASTLRARLEEGRLEAGPAFAALLRAYGVTHVISPLPIPALASAVPVPARGGIDLSVYRVPGASRVRVVERAVVARDTRAARDIMTGADFDPDAVVVLDGVAAAEAGALEPAVTAAAVGAARAEIAQDGDEEVLVRAHAPRGGFLVLADSYFPGWTATLDGIPAPIHRANVSVRAVRLPPGAHEVRFRFRPLTATRARAISWSALGALVLLLGAALVRAGRERRALVAAQVPGE